MHQSAYTPAMALLEMATFAGIGLIAGLIGGLLGIGGSTVFIPAASLIIAPDQQIYQAAAMILNVFVSGTATLTHYRAGAIDFRLVRRIVPAAVLFVLLGGSGSAIDSTQPSSSASLGDYSCSLPQPKPSAYGGTKSCDDKQP